MRTTSLPCTLLSLARTSTARSPASQLPLPLVARHAVQKCDNIARQLETAAADMAKMAMDYADLGEQLQVGAAAAVKRMRTRALIVLRFFFARFFGFISLPAAVKDRAHAAASAMRRRRAGVQRGERAGAGHRDAG